MTRLREALEKAVSQSAVEQTEPSAGTPHFADPAQLVPDAWDLDGVEDAARKRSNHLAAARRSPAAAPPNARRCEHSTRLRVQR